MPVYSMTGYASSCLNTTPSVEKNDASVSINLEIRSVNSRFLDLNFRLPEDLRTVEPSLRTLISGKIKRGKVEIRLTFDHGHNKSSLQISTQALRELARYSDIVRNWLPDVTPLSVSEVIHLSQTQVKVDNLQNEIIELTQKAVEQLMSARAREGEKLAQSIHTRVAALRELVTQAQPLIPQVVEQQRLRFLERWQQTLQQASPQLQAESAQNIEERALTEATAFALRIDVAEELTRLNTHLDEIDRLLKKGGELGKRLDFIIQELHREANTLGSKSAAIELTQISLDMRVLIEQMREQVQNLE